MLVVMSDDDQTFDSPSTSGQRSPSEDESPAVRPGNEAEVNEELGTVIGPYKLLQRIGEGGFGVVYMAEQSVPVRRRVALKIIKQGMDTRQVIARFEAERQALAMMDHINIARVLDAGATESGRPYFVMELVRGEPITDYCDKHELSTNERLDLFRDVCHAVQHAHTKGIIHRDIKPTNILVTVADAKPVPKVIDFGIAKATSSQLTDKTLFTEMRQLVGTPEYMSPEQAEMSAADIDTRTDIYSLGVVLYELLTGTTPFDKARLRSAPYSEIQKMIREQEPQRPSTRLDSMSGTFSVQKANTTVLQAVAAGQRTEPRELVRRIKGELDWIVMKAIEKDRTRRYETADRFAEDIGRYLKDEPVLARPASAAYRMRKFARRNRALLLTGTAVVAALAMTSSALAYALVRVSNERERQARDAIVGNAEILLTTMNSVRKYTTDLVRPRIQSVGEDAYEDFARETVPGFAAREVFERVRDADEYRYFLYKEATLNPTNPRDQADEFETGLVEQFRADPNLKETTGFKRSDKDQFYIARPIRINDPSCLRCHSTPDRAPQSMIDMYGSEGGFNWTMGEIVGAQIVYVPAEQVRAVRTGTDMAVAGGLVGAFIIVVGGAALFVTRA